MVRCTVKKSMAFLLIVCLMLSAIGIFHSNTAQAASAPNKISIQKTAIVYHGKTVTLKATLSPKGAKGTILWSSGNKSVATVTSKGVVKGVKPGTAKITAQVKGKSLKVQCTVTVKPILITSISCKEASLKAGQKLTLKPTVNPSNATSKKLEYTSSNTKVATVGKNDGVVVGKTAGTVTITIKATDGSKKTANVKVIVNPALATGLNVSIPKTTLLAGKDKVQIKSTVSPSNASSNVKYTSSDPYAATVSSTGLVTALAQGSTIITVETLDGSKLKKTINLKIDYDRVNDQRPLVLVTSDGEVDDLDSWIHYIMYSDEMDFAGIVQTSSQHHWEGRPSAPYEAGKSPYRWPGKTWIYEVIDAYEKVYENLRVHSSKYPTPNYLRSVSAVGNIGYRSEMESSTEGSNLVKKAILDRVFNDEDERVLYIQHWGGRNTTARALLDIELEYKHTMTAEQWDAFQQKVYDKVCFSSCGDQDQAQTWYITPSWPGIKNINGNSQTAYGYSTKATNTAHAGTYEFARVMGGDWMRENIDYGHGPLYDMYVTWGDGTPLDYEPPGSRFGDNELMVGTSNWWSGRIYERYHFLSEGDSPCFFFFFNNGLRNVENGRVNGNYGGWSGRLNSATGAGVNDYVTKPGENDPTGSRAEQSMIRWSEYIQHDFAARADWCINSKYSGANHRPNISITEGLDLTAAPGALVTLHAKTSDPDGDSVRVNWWHYPEAGKDTSSTVASHPDQLTMLGGSNGQNAYITSFRIPANAQPGEKYHIIAEAIDSGTHNLAYFQRVIVTVQPEASFDMKIGVTDAVKNQIDENGKNLIYSNQASDDKAIWVEFTPKRPGAEIIWSSSNSGIVSIGGRAGTAYGTITTSGTGTATITATDVISGQTVSLDLSVKMVGTVGAITLPTGMDADAIPLGGPVALSSTATLANGGHLGVEWDSSDKSVATVDANGVVTPLKVGTTIISVRTNDGGGGQSASDRRILKLKIVPGVAIKLPAGRDATSIDVNGGTFALTANAAPVAVASCTWATSAPGVATVDAAGVVTPVAAGDATITATATLTDGSTSTATVALKLINPVAEITITSPVGNTISANTTLTAVCTPNEATTKTVRWYTSDPSIATINSSTGALVPMKSGAVTITAVANDGSGTVGTINLNIVYKLITSVTLNVPVGVNASAISLGGGTVQIASTIAPVDASKQTLTGWTSSNTAVATISTSGLVTPRAAGTTIITARSNDGSSIVSTIELTIVSP